ncbi:MAG: glutathione S-transferase N-terminal domain-containing protein [Mesorhizobium sp.]|nr:glutathione S-transferase N-terminal domain-containing protein [Mesorhizobium sp.]
MDFFYTPGTCSQAAHILLREAGLAFRAHKVDIFSGKVDDGSDYRAINPNGYVPAIALDDGTLLTENVALLDWIDAQYAEAVSPTPMERYRYLQMLAFLSAEVHKPFVRLFFTESDDEKAYLRQVLAQRFAWIGSAMRGPPHSRCARFSASDAFAYVMLRWAAMVELEVPQRLRALARLVEARDAVRTVLAAEEQELLGMAA